jgi:protein phosphatase 4 regulatory subunit 3
VHHTYRLQFLKDVVLARAIDDATFNVLNSCIVFNQIDIINYVQNDPNFLRDVVKLFIEGDMGEVVGPPPPVPAKVPEGVVVKQEANGAPNGDASSSSADEPEQKLSPEAEAKRRREVILLIQHLCAMGKNVQLPQRMALFRVLVDRGVLCAVQWALSCNEKEDQGRAMVAAGGEIMSALLDHDLNGVRGHVVKQVQAAERRRAAASGNVEAKVLQTPIETVLLVVCRIMASSRDLAVQSLVGDSLKTLLEIAQDADAHVSPQDLSAVFDMLNFPSQPAVAVKMLSRAKDDPGTEKFMDYFYKQCIQTLFKPIDDIPEFKNLAGAYTSTSCAYIGLTEG